MLVVRLLEFSEYFSPYCWRGFVFSCSLMSASIPVFRSPQYNDFFHLRFLRNPFPVLQFSENLVQGWNTTIALRGKLDCCPQQELIKAQRSDNSAEILNFALCYYFLASIDIITSSSSVKLVRNNFSASCSSRCCVWCLLFLHHRLTELCQHNTNWTLFA